MNINTDTVHQQRKQNAVDRIKDGKYEVVIIVKMLLEGFDHPPFSVAGIVRKIRSSLTFEQFIGRTQRLVRSKQGTEDDKVIANIITHEYFEQENLYKKFIDPEIPAKDPVIPEKDDDQVEE